MLCLCVSLTLGGLTVSDHEGSYFVPRGQQLPLGIFSAHTLEEPPQQQETDWLVLKPCNVSPRICPDIFHIILPVLFPCAFSVCE